MYVKLLILFICFFSLSCDNEASISDSSKQKGFTVQNINVTVHPTYADYTFKYSYGDRYGSWQEYFVKTGQSGSGSQKNISDAFVIDTINSFSGSICCLLKYHIGDSVMVHIKFIGNYIDSTSSGFVKSDEIQFFDSLKCIVVE